MNKLNVYVTESEWARFKDLPSTDSVLPHFGATQEEAKSCCEFLGGRLPLDSELDKMFCPVWEWTSDKGTRGCSWNNNAESARISIGSMYFYGDRSDNAERWLAFRCIIEANPKPTVAIRSETKPFYIGIDPDIMYRLAKTLSSGNAKYGIRNWQLGDHDFAIDVVNHLYDHLRLFLEGDTMNEDHLVHAIANIQMMNYFDKKSPGMYSEFSMSLHDPDHDAD